MVASTKIYSAAIGSILSGVILIQFASRAHAETPLAKVSTKTTMVFPAEEIRNACPAGASKGKPVVIKLSGIKITQEGRLQLKRDIKTADLDDQTNVPDDLSDTLPYEEIPNVMPTPFDIAVGNQGHTTTLVRIKIVVRKGVGASFFGSGDTDGQYFAIRAGLGQSKYFCGLTAIDSTVNREAITFSVLSGATAGFAVGIIVPEVDFWGNKTARSLPIFIDPNVRNKG